VFAKNHHRELGKKNQVFENSRKESANYEGRGRGLGISLGEGPELQKGVLMPRPDNSPPAILLAERAPSRKEGQDLVGFKKLQAG